MRRRELQNEGVTSKLERKFNVKRKGVEVVHEKVRQRLVVVGGKFENYDNRTEQSSTSRIHYLNQTKRDCSTNWDEAVTNRENADWLRKTENKLGELTVRDDIHIEIKN